MTPNLSGYLQSKKPFPTPEAAADAYADLVQQAALADATETALNRLGLAVEELGLPVSAADEDLAAVHAHAKATAEAAAQREPRARAQAEIDRLDALIKELERDLAAAKAARQEQQQLVWQAAQVMSRPGEIAAKFTRVFTPGGARRWLDWRRREEGAVSAGGKRSF